MVLSEIGLSGGNAVYVEVVLEELTFFKTDHYAAQTAKQCEDWIRASETYLATWVTYPSTNGIAELLSIPWCDQSQSLLSLH